MKVKNVGKDIGIEVLNNKIYDVVNVEDDLIRVVCESGEDYLFPIVDPCNLANPNEVGKWEIIEDNDGKLKSLFEKFIN